PTNYPNGRTARDSGSPFGQRSGFPRTKTRTKTRTSLIRCFVAGIPKPSVPRGRPLSARAGAPGRVAVAVMPAVQAPFVSVAGQPDEMREKRAMPALWEVVVLVAGHGGC